MPVFAPSPPLEAVVVVPSAGQCLMVLAPVAAWFLLRWILRGIDPTIHRLFPSLEWERQLGWLNIRAERQAARFLRWAGYLVQATLAAALYALAWGAEGFRLLGRWSDPDALAEIDLRLPVFFCCLGLWLLYLGAALFPRLRREYEQDELAAFRAEWSELNEEERVHSRLASQMKSPVMSRPRSRSPRPL
jgi:hypothetical protein